MRSRIPVVLVLAFVTTAFLGILSPTASAQQACAPAWQAGISVSVGQIVSFPLIGVPHNWQAIQPEVQAAPDWCPPATPALWTDIGACGGGGCTVRPNAPTGLTASNIT